MGFWVYIVASDRNGTIYTGHTDDLGRRMVEHREKLRAGFTKKHGCTRLVWAEWHETRETALIREKRIKEWKRPWKLRLIEAENPMWKDLYPDILQYGS